MMYLLITEINNGVDFTRQELRGNLYLRSLTKLWNHTLQGKVAIQKPNSDFRQAQIQIILTELESTNQNLEDKLETQEKFSKLKTLTQSLSLIDSKQNSFIYEQIINETKKLRTHIGNTSNLILDPNLDTYYLMDTNLSKLPELQEMLTEIEFLGLKAIGHNQLNPQEKLKLAQLSALLSEQIQNLSSNVNTAIKYNPTNNLTTKITKDLNNLVQNLQKISKNLDRVISNNQKLSPTTIDLIKSTTIETFKFGEKTIDELDFLLNQRIDELHRKQLLISLFMAIILLVVVYLFIGFYQSVMQTISSLEIAAKRMTNRSEGTLETISLDTKDELGLVVNSFNRIAVALVEAIAAAHDSELKYRSIFENAIEGIFQTLPDGKYISANPSLVKMYGYESEVEMMAAFTDIERQLYVNPYRRQDFIDLMAEKNQVIRFESEIYCKGGKTIWISEDARAVRDNGDNLLYYEGSVKDISDRIAAEKSLAQANRAIILLNEQLKAENMRMSAELSISRRLQQMILPKDAELSKIRELDISGYMEPASEVGGDYYDILVEDGGRIKIGIGDVTGHGLESSVLTIMVQTAVRTLLVHNETDPVKFLNTLNRTIYDNVKRMESSKNLTLALIDYDAGKLTISGQHEEMIIVRATGVIERIDTIDLGFPIGLEPQISEFIYKTELQLLLNDIAVLYTDGVTEAENINKNQYGIERLCAVVKANSQLGSEDIRLAVINDLRSHIGAQEVFDDITLLVIKQK